MANNVLLQQWWLYSLVQEAGTLLCQSELNSFWDFKGMVTGGYHMNAYVIRKGLYYL